jgi:hypothetical protein
VCGGFPYCGIGVPGDLGLGEKNIVEKNGRTVFFFYGLSWGINMI